MWNRILFLALLSGGLLASSFARAQAVYAATPPLLSIQQAGRIAVLNGAVAIGHINFYDGFWKIQGIDQAGRYLTLRIDARTGRVVDLFRN